MSLDVRISRAGVLRVSASDETTRWGLEAWAGQDDPAVEVALDNADTITLRRLCQQPAAPAPGPSHVAHRLAIRCANFREKLADAEERLRDATHRAEKAEENARIADKNAKEAEGRVRVMGRQIGELGKRAQNAEQRARDMEAKLEQAEAENAQLRERIGSTEDVFAGHEWVQKQFADGVSAGMLLNQVLHLQNVTNPFRFGCMEELTRSVVGKLRICENANDRLQRRIDSLQGVEAPARPGYPPIMNRDDDNA